MSKPENQIHVYVHLVSQSVDSRLDQVIGLLNTILTKDTNIMATIQDVQAAVAAESTVIDSVEVLLTELTAKIGALPTTDPATQAAIDGLVADVTAKSAELAAAVTANTPAA